MEWNWQAQAYSLAVQVRLARLRRRLMTSRGQKQQVKWYSNAAEGGLQYWT